MILQDSIFGIRDSKRFIRFDIRDSGFETNQRIRYSGFGIRNSFIWFRVRMWDAKTRCIFNLIFDFSFFESWLQSINVSIIFKKSVRILTTVPSWDLTKLLIHCITLYSNVWREGHPHMILGWRYSDIFASEFGPVAPSEALVERFYSIAGFVWNNRRYNLDTRHVSCVAMKHLLWKIYQGEKDDDNWLTSLRYFLLKILDVFQDLISEDHVKLFLPNFR